MSFTVLIPARKGSTRLPNKPLLDINGKLLIERVYLQAIKSNAVRVIVATDSKTIKEKCKSFGAEVVLTDSKHKSGTDRIEEAARLVNLDPNGPIVNVQGDEPFIDPSDINSVADLLSTNRFDITTLYSPLLENQIDNRNVVKIWVKENEEVLSFSRNKNELGSLDEIRFRHLGIYGYKLSTIKLFVSLKRTKGEKEQKLEQLRALENGYSFGARRSSSTIHLGIDTEEDLLKAREYLQNGN